MALKHVFMIVSVFVTASTAPASKTERSPLSGVILTHEDSALKTNSDSFYTKKRTFFEYAAITHLRGVVPTRRRNTRRKSSMEA